jgi:hypothetical protein
MGTLPEPHLGVGGAKGRGAARVEARTLGARRVEGRIFHLTGSLGANRLSFRNGAFYVIAVDPILDFLNICIWTGVIEGEKPVNVLVIAESSSGKSEILKHLQCEISVFLTDLTTRDLSMVMNDPKKRIVLLSDMQAIFSHKSTVVGTTTQALRNLLEEGIYNDPYSAQKINRRFGMITAIPPQEFNRINRIFCSGGLDTRFLIFQFEYKKGTIAKIHDAVEKGDANDLDKEKPLHLPEDGQFRKVTIPPKVARQCRGLAAVLKRDDIGLRVHHQIRALVMGSAARSQRRIATSADYEIVAKYADFLRPNAPERMTL